MCVRVCVCMCVCVVCLCVCVCVCWVCVVGVHNSRIWTWWFSLKNSCQMERITGRAWHYRLTCTVCSHEMLSCTIWGLYQQPNQTKQAPIVYNIYNIYSQVTNPYPLAAHTLFSFLQLKSKLLVCTKNFLVVLSQQYWFWTTINYMFVLFRVWVYTHTWMMWHYFIGLSKIKTVDSAQPRNHSIVTLFLMRRWGLGTRLRS